MMSTLIVCIEEMRMSHLWLSETCEQELSLPVVHADHPNQGNHVVLVDLLPHYSHPVLVNQALHLLQGGPGQ